MVLKHTAVYAIAQLATALAGFLSLLVYTRLLPAAEYGAYAVCIACVQVAHVALYGWLGAGVNRFYPVVRVEDRGRFLATLAFNFAIMSVVAGILGLVAGILCSNRWKPLWI